MNFTYDKTINKSRFYIQIISLLGFFFGAVLWSFVNDSLPLYSKTKVSFTSISELSTALSQTREIDVVVLYDSSYKTYRKWEKRIDKTMEALNKAFDKFDIAFNIIEKSTFEFSDSIFIHPKTFDQLFAQRTTVSGEKADFVIFLTGKKFKYFSGKAIEKKFAMIVCTEKKEFEKFILIHEMGHLFGLPHVTNSKKDNYMRMISTNYKSKGFVPENEEMINLAREIDFKADTISSNLIKNRLPLLLKMYKNYASDHTLLEKIGKTYFFIGKYDSAMYCFLKEWDYLNSLHTVHKDSLYEFYQESLRSIGLTYYKLDSLSLSLDFFINKLKIRPDDSEAFYALGKIFAEMADLVYEEKQAVDTHITYWQESLAALALTNQTFSQNPDFRFLQGLAHLRLGNHFQAINAFNKVIGLKKDLVESYYNLGLIYIETDSLSRAIQMFNSAIRYNPDFPDAYLGLGNTYFNLGRWEEAKTAYEESIQLQPNFAQAHFNLGLTYLRLGVEEAAVEECNILKDLDLELSEKLCNYIKRQDHDF